jgi:hypothetical protein
MALLWLRVGSAAMALVRIGWWNMSISFNTNYTIYNHINFYYGKSNSSILCCISCKNSLLSYSIYCCIIYICIIYRLIIINLVIQKLIVNICKSGDYKIYIENYCKTLILTCFLHSNYLIFVGK